MSTTFKAPISIQSNHYSGEAVKSRGSDGAKVLEAWAAAEPGKVIEGLTVKQEIELLERALDRQDLELFDEYGGMQGAVERYKELMMGHEPQ